MPGECLGVAAVASEVGDLELFEVQQPEVAVIGLADRGEQRVGGDVSVVGGLGVSVGGPDGGATGPGVRECGGFGEVECDLVVAELSGEQAGLLPLREHAEEDVEAFDEPRCAEALEVDGLLCGAKLRWRECDLVAWQPVAPLGSVALAKEEHKAAGQDCSGSSQAGEQP